MSDIDKSIYTIDDLFSNNLRLYQDCSRGLLSQNILSQLRNLLEYVAQKIFIKGIIEPLSYKQKQEAKNKLMSANGEYRFLGDFYRFLEISVSHYTIDENGSERLMLKYYEYLLKLRELMHRKYNMNILECLYLFPLDIDDELYDYQKKISLIINRPTKNYEKQFYNDRYYIQKITPFFVDESIYYEIVFTIANNKTSKFDRVIAYSKCNIMENYAVKFEIHRDQIEMWGRKMYILVIDSWKTAIRPCEISNFIKIVYNKIVNIKSNSKEYKDLMEFIYNVKMPLSDILSNDNFKQIKDIVFRGKEDSVLFKTFLLCRRIILEEKPGANIIKYLLLRMNNKIIKSQFRDRGCNLLSNLYLEYGCIPFDKMPYCTSLIGHNPRIKDLNDCFYDRDKQQVISEKIARYLKNKANQEGVLFHCKSDISKLFAVDNLDDLINFYNSRLYSKHTGRRICEIKNYIYIKSYVEDCIYIINKLNGLSCEGRQQYGQTITECINDLSYKIDSEEKKDILKKLFDKSNVALVYGAAGTGKTTLITYISNIFCNKRIAFIANTHAALTNLQQRIKSNHCNFFTMASFLNRVKDLEYDLIIIDECSTISNQDMKKLLEYAKFHSILLVGDTNQIEAIIYGSWFNISRFFLKTNIIFELKTPYRTKNEKLIDLWNKVRFNECTILETLATEGYSKRLDESVLYYEGGDEIILCLNYDGLYGINNINRFLQNSNPNKPEFWGVNIYKKGDPILFNDACKFSPLIHNNTKGKIIDIRKNDRQIYFTVMVDFPIDELDAKMYDFSLIKVTVDNKSIIEFSVNKYKSTDEDDDDMSTAVPFQIAYAVSIHKSQGLEYDSVKIIITNSVEDEITHNIFYTAITRTKEKLVIFWSPECEKAIIEKLFQKNYGKDVSILRANFFR